MATDRIVAVSSKVGQLCVACAEKRYGVELGDVDESGGPDGVTAVYDSDDWKGEFDGVPCDDCGEAIDIEPPEEQAA